MDSSLGAAWGHLVEDLTRIRATGADFSAIEHLSVALATTFLRNERAYDARVTPA